MGGRQTKLVQSLSTLVRLSLYPVHNLTVTDIIFRVSFDCRWISSCAHGRHSCHMWSEGCEENYIEILMLSIESGCFLALHCN